MRVFVTGASGWIGSAAVTELLAAGHQVTGLARSDAGASAVAALGAQVRRGDLAALDTLRAAAESSDAVVHLGYNHDFSQMAAAARTDRAVIDAVGDVLAGSGRPLLIAGGVLGLTDGRPATERDVPELGAHPRSANAAAVLALAARGVRPVVVRFAPTVHGAGDHGFIATLTEIARAKGAAGYVGDGSSRWPAVHRQDAATLIRLALENAADGFSAGAPAPAHPTPASVTAGPVADGRAAAGSVVHAVAEEGVPARAIAEAIGRGLNLPVRSVPADEAAAHFGWIGAFFAADVPVSSALTQDLLGWKPAHPTLLEDLDAGHYFHP